MIFDWLRRRAAAKALIEADAHQLIAGFGDEAYGVARLRQCDDWHGIVDANRPPEHWSKVRREIRRIENRR